VFGTKIDRFISAGGNDDSSVTKQYHFKLQWVMMHILTLFVAIAFKKTFGP
jgi:hypothetical protein